MLYAILTHDRPSRSRSRNDDGEWRPHAAGLVCYLVLTYWAWLSGAAAMAGSRQKSFGILSPTPRHATLLFVLFVTFELGSWTLFALSGFQRVFSNVAALSVLSGLLFANSAGHALCAWVCAFDAQIWIFKATEFTKRNPRGSVMTHGMAALGSLIAAVIVLTLAISGGSWGSGGGGGGGGGSLGEWRPPVVGYCLWLVLLGWSLIAAFAAWVDRRAEAVGMFHPSNGGGQAFGLLTIAALFQLLAWLMLVLCGFDQAMSVDAVRAFLASCLIVNMLGQFACAVVCGQLHCRRRQHRSRRRRARPQRRKPDAG